jgi:alpha-galactosidase/6-phospho-beta-glucosidase family protein
VTLGGPKIVMVGGGSYNWGPSLLSDLVQAPEMDGSEVVLLDRDLHAASEIRAVGERYATVFHKTYHFRVTNDEVSALRDADFVMITISTGGLEAMAFDLAIPEKYGVYHTVGDSVGPGGWARTLRNVPVMVQLGEQMARYAPHAVILNYTNPMATLTGALAQASGLRVVGLCHGVFDNYHVLEKLFAVEEKDLDICFGGVNHFFWVLDFTVKGQPGYPLLREKLDSRSLDEVLRNLMRDDDQDTLHRDFALCSELYEQYGYLPYIADRHTCEFVPGYVTPSPGSLVSFRLVRTTVGERKASREVARNRALKLAAGEIPPPTRSRETAVDMMVALCTRKPFVDVVNVPNIGQVDSLPRRAVVETLGIVDHLGFRPIAAGPLPPFIHRLVAPHCDCQLVTLEAAIKGDRELALQALMLDPLCSHLSHSRIKDLGKDLMAAQRELLPQFK